MGTARTGRTGTERRSARTPPPEGEAGTVPGRPGGPGPVARWCAGTVVAVCAVASCLHVVWAFSPWPARTWEEWNRTVTGVDDAAARSGPGWVAACLLVTGLLAGAAYAVGARAGLLRRSGPWWGPRIASWAVAGAFLVRGVLGFVEDVPGDLPAHDWNLYLYSPLCLVLGALSVTVAVVGEPAAGDRTGAAGERG